jgi:hypothetical protein
VPGFWRVLVDTSGSQPPDLSPAARWVPEGPMIVQARSIVVLAGRAA